MIAPRLKKVFRDILSNKTRTVLVVVSIAIGVLAVGATVTIQSILSREMVRNYADTRPASGSVSIPGLVQEDFVNAVRQMPAVIEAEGRASTIVLVPQDPDDASKSKYLSISAIADFDAMRLNQIKPDSGAAGRVPPPARRSIVLGTVSMGLLNVRAGDVLHIQTFDNRKYDLTVAGPAWSVEEGGGPFAQFGNGWVTQDTWEYLGNSRGYDSVLFRVGNRATERDYIVSVGNEIKERLQREGKTATINVNQNPDQHPAATTVNALVALMTLIGAMSLVLSGFLVINTISAVLVQHTRQIGVMKTIGGRNGQIAGMYFEMVLLYGGLSLLIALPLGLLGSRLFVEWMGGTLLNLRISDFTPPASVYALQFGIALLAPVLAALSPVLGGARKTVREAINDYGVESTGGTSKPQPRLLARISRPLMLSLRNTFRHKGRLLLTLATLILGGAIFIGVLSARQALTNTLDVALAYWGFDFDANLAGSYPEDTLLRVAYGVPGVKTAESWGFGSMAIENADHSLGESWQVTAPPADTRLLAPILLRGRWLLDSDTDALVLNTDALKRLPGVDVGDIITVKINNAIRAQVRVVGVVQGVLTGPNSYMTRGGFARIAQTGANSNYFVVKSNTVDAQQNIAIARELKEALKRANITVTNTTQMAQQRATITSTFDVVIYMLLSMAVLLAVVGGLGLAGTMSINVIERTREIGVMRAIGAGNGAIRAIVISEGVLIGLISWLIGALLAVPAGYGIAALLSKALEFDITGTVSFAGMFGWLAAVILIATVASVLPAWNASRLTVREVLAYA